MILYIVALTVIAGFGVLLWRRSEQGEGWKREASFFFDLLAMGATALIVGLLALLQLGSELSGPAAEVAAAPPSPTREVTATVRPEPTVEIEPTPEPTPIPLASSTPEPEEEDDAGPEPTPEPEEESAEPTPEPTPEPTATAEPTATPSPASSGERREYTVVSGDSISVIARRFGTTTGAILALNPGVSADSLRIGQVLIIPGEGETPAAVNRSYTVQQGDVLSVIARDHGVTTGQILALNPGVNADSLRVGTVLTIPPAGSGSASSGPSRGTVSYTVQSGDNFGTIARRFGVTVAQLEAANPGVDSSRLRIGQSINIPNQPLP